MPGSYDINVIRQFLEDEREPHEEQAQRIRKAAETLVQCDAFIAFLRLQSQRSGNFVMNQKLTRQSDDCRRALNAIDILTEPVDDELTRQAKSFSAKLAELMLEIRLVNYSYIEGYFQEHVTLPTEETALRMAGELRQYVLHMKDTILDSEECAWMRKCLVHVFGAMESVFNKQPEILGRIAPLKTSLEELVTRSERSRDETQ